MKQDDLDSKVAKFADNLLLEQEAMIERPGESRQESTSYQTSSNWAFELGVIDDPREHQSQAELD